MNKSHFEHALIAAILHIAVGLVTSNWIYGAFLVLGVFWSREHAQKQVKIANDTYTKLKDVPWYKGANMLEWSDDAKLDFAIPMIVSVVIAIVGSVIT